jgi:pyruvate ferredoxin oxidoreductase gamma subunit
MYRIRFHGRGGQGMKTASRILGRAFFLAGWEVQDAPRYGAERRGAPVFAYVRAGRRPVFERGIIDRPDLIVVADESLMGMAAAGVLAGCGPRTVLLVHGREGEKVWRERLNLSNLVCILPLMAETPKLYLGAACAGGAARLLGMIDPQILDQAVRQEIAPLGEDKVVASLAAARHAYATLADRGGIVREGEAVSAAAYTVPAWIELSREDVQLAAPAIHAAATSEMVKTGLWRTVCPVIDEERCKRCWWICSTFCPEGAILVDDRQRPRIDYEHCKGCMICLAQCPTHAIEARPEEDAKPSGGTGQ